MYKQMNKALHDRLTIQLANLSDNFTATILYYQ